MHFTHYVLNSRAATLAAQTETNGFSIRDVAIIGVKNSRSRSLFFLNYTGEFFSYVRPFSSTRLLCRAARERERKSGAADNVGACESAAYLLRRFRVTRLFSTSRGKLRSPRIVRFRAPSPRERRRNCVARLNRENRKRDHRETRARILTANRSAFPPLFLSPSR